RGGLFGIAVLQNGMRLGDLPAEGAGALTAGLLLLAIGIESRSLQSGGRKSEHGTTEGELSMKNSQLAVLCGVILAGAALVALSNWNLARSVRDIAGM